MSRQNAYLFFLFMGHFSSSDFAISAVVVKLVARENEDRRMTTNSASWIFWQL